MSLPPKPDDDGSVEGAVVVVVGACVVDVDDELDVDDGGTVVADVDVVDGAAGLAVAVGVCAAASASAAVPATEPPATNSVTNLARRTI